MGRFSLDRILDEHGDSAVGLKKLAANCQALQAFEDLQDLNFPPRGGYFTSQNYCFYESISVLREVIISGLNGAFHCSFAGMRSSMELMAAHYWWKSRGLLDREFHTFYRWLQGDSGIVPFTDIRRDIYTGVAFPDGGSDRGEFEKVYKAVNAYAHRPTLDESITSVRRTNSPVYGYEALDYWSALVGRAVACLVHLSVVKRPICLFPVNTIQKFGFNAPLNLFFDDSGYSFLSDAVGEDVLSLYREIYRDDDTVSVLEWYHGLPDLSDNEILESYSGNGKFDDAGRSFEEQVSLRWMAIKAEVRALSLFFAYTLSGPSLDDVEDLVRKHFGDSISK
ncbi:MAG TPA: hypothetical protein VGL38_03415 [bacterium]